MPQIAQRLREPAAFVLLAYAVLSTLFALIDFLFAPSSVCGSGGCGWSFPDRALGAFPALAAPVLMLVLVASVVLAHVVEQIKSAKTVALVALITVGLDALFAVIALLAEFGARDGGWDKTERFLVGVAQLAIVAVAGWFILGYFQMHAPERPAAPAEFQPPQKQFAQQQQQQQWQAQAQQHPQAAPAWQPPPQQAPAAPPTPPQQGQWGQPQQPQQPQQQPASPWGQPQPPQQQGYEQQQGYAGGSESMMTQAIPTIQPQPTPQLKPQGTPQGQVTHVTPPTGNVGPGEAAPETQAFPPIGNWTSEG